MSKAQALPDPDLDAKLDEAFGDAAGFKAAMTAAVQSTPQAIVIGQAEVTLAQPRSLAEALAAVQARIPEVVKGEEGKVEKDGKTLYKYSYADLSAVTRAILPMLGSVGLSWVTMPTMVDGKFVLVYKLLHASGESLEGMYPLPAGQSPQQTGSAITYARRYCLCSVTGVAPSDDDDAAEAQAAHTKANATPGPVGMSRFERETGLVLLYPPSADQRAAAGPLLMSQAFRQALDFSACIAEHNAWNVKPMSGNPLTWEQLLNDRIADEVAAAETGTEVNAIWEQLKTMRLTNELRKAILKGRADQIKERNAKAYDTLVQQITTATYEDIKAVDGPVGTSVAQAFALGRITAEQRDELMPLVGERIKKLEREMPAAEPGRGIASAEELAR